MGKILLADDSNVAQRMGKEILSAEGFEVLTASNGQAALKMLKQFTPDLILADVFMPGRNGYELCQFVKSEAQLRHVPVILLVGALEPYDAEEGKKVKADGMLTKPLQSSTLVEIVKGLLSSVQAPAPPPAPVPTIPVQQAPPVEEEPEAASAQESPEEAAPSRGRLEISQEMADQPVAAFGESLEFPVESQEKLEAPPESPVPEVLSPLPFPFAPEEAASSESAEAGGLPEGSKDTVVPEGELPSCLETSRETPAAESLSPLSIPFPQEETVPLESAEAEVQPEETSSLITSSGEAQAGSMDYYESTFEESPPPPSSPPQEAPALTASSEDGNRQEEAALEQPPMVDETSAGPVFFSNLGVMRVAEKPEPPPQPLAEPPSPEKMVWTAEPAAVTAEDEELVEQHSSDLEKPVKMAEAETAPGPASIILPEPQPTAAPVVPARETTPPEPVPVAAGPSHLQTEEMETKPPSADPAAVERLVRESVEHMMPQIVDRIVRTVEIILRREQK